MVLPPAKDPMYTALFEAARNGDVAALETCFADPVVRAEVDDTERYVIANEIEFASFWRRSATGDLYPWYIMTPSPYTKFQFQNLFIVAVDASQFEVVEWFFAPPRLHTMRATLALVWSPMAKAAHSTRNHEILEFLLNVVGSDWLPNDRRDKLLTDAMVASTWPSPAMIDIVLAHGGVVQTEGMIRYVGWAAHEDTLDFVDREGAFIVGADAMKNCSLMGPQVRRLLKLGADGYASCDGLLEVVRADNIETVEMFIADTFVDVDKRDRVGRTALMVLAVLDPEDVPLGEQGILSAAKALLDAGADPALEDIDGMTALDHAKRIKNESLVEFLLTQTAKRSTG